MGIKCPCHVILKFFMKKKDIAFLKKLCHSQLQCIVNYLSIALILSFPHLKLEFTKIMKVLHLVNYYWFKKKQNKQGQKNKNKLGGITSKIVQLANGKPRKLVRGIFCKLKQSLLGVFNISSLVPSPNQGRIFLVAILNFKNVKFRLEELDLNYWGDTFIVLYNKPKEILIG